jgi:hypothetical protein
MVRQVALVSDTQTVSSADVARVSAALQKQAVRDFGPIWDIQATVDAFDKLEDVPINYWPIIIRDDIKQPGAAGVHSDKNGQPFALVQTADDWPLTASHECLEMLADPSGNRLVAGNPPKLAPKKQKRVEYLVEVCDPSEATQFGYTVNGIQMSDFITPHYYDPVKAASGVRYSFTGAITEPRQVLKGGYVSWHDPISNRWFQITWFSGTKPALRDLGVLARASRSLREMIDEATTTPQMANRFKPRKLTEARLLDETCESTAARADSLRQEIKTLVAKA